MRRYEGLGERHLAGLRTGTSGPATVWLRCRTRTSDIRVVLAAQTRVTGAEPLSCHVESGRRRAVNTLTADDFPELRASHAAAWARLPCRDDRECSR